MWSCRPHKYSNTRNQLSSVQLNSINYHIIPMSQICKNMFPCVPFVSHLRFKPRKVFLSWNTIIGLSASCLDGHITRQQFYEKFNISPKQLLVMPNNWCRTNSKRPLVLDPRPREKARACIKTPPGNSHVKWGLKLNQMELLHVHVELFYWFVSSGATVRHV